MYLGANSIVHNITPRHSEQCCRNNGWIIAPAPVFTSLFGSFFIAHNAAKIIMGGGINKTRFVNRRLFTRGYISITADRVRRKVSNCDNGGY